MHSDPQFASNLPIPFLEMRRVALPVLLCLASAACGVADANQPAGTVTSTTTVVTTTTTPSTTTTVAPTTTEAEVLDVASLPGGSSLVLGAREAVEVFAGPNGSEMIRTLEPTTILGTTTVLMVVEGPNEGWARVLLPGRPNGAEGWVRTDEMVAFVVEGRVVIDLSDRTLSYLVGDTEIIATTVGVGSETHPTPTGKFFVTDSVAMADPTSPWGPHALGLSARSDTVTEYNGGDGIIGIHGTNNPWSIGRAMSLGCLRVANDVITRLHEVVAIGTPVVIRA
jgi:lipoprotein-anchoring transpeptidase ErfK/SrfK